MFYHQGILQKRGGKFGIIWLAATRIENLKRRELSGVNLQKTCDDILEHIMVGIQGRTTGKKKIRFSLYLSSQLMYGVTRVLSKQNDYLFDDASTFFTRIRLAVAPDAEADIDLRGIFRCETVTIPDIATIDSPGQPGFDPSFGLMRLGSSDTKITYPELEMWRVNSSMVVPGSPYLSPIQKRRGSSIASKDDSHMIQPELGSPQTVSSKEEITIREEELKIPDIEVPGEKDLPTFDGKELDIILEEPMDPRINWLTILSPSVQEPQKETTLDQVAQEQGSLSPKEQTPFSRPDGEVPQRRDITLSPGITPIPKMTPVQAKRMRPSLTIQLTPVTPSPVRRRRRRHLCIDRNTQISKEQLRNNMKTGADTCQPLVLPDPRNSTVKNLFSRPGKKALNHPSIFPLWDNNTKYGISETDSDRAIPVWSVPDLHLQENGEPRSRKRLRISTTPPERQASPPQNIRQDVTMEQPMVPEVAPEMASIEIPRDTSVSMERSRHGDVTPVSIHHSHSLISEVDKDKDSFTDEPSAKRRRSTRKTRSRAGTSSEDDQADITAQVPSEVSFPTREDVSVTGNLSIVQEEEIHVNHDLQDIPAIVTEPQHSPHRDQLIRTIDQLDREATPITFHHICPPLTSSRKMAAKMFHALLELCADDKVEAQQYCPYDDIYITKGHNW